MAHVIQLRFNTGDIVTLEGTKLIGRAPVVHPGEAADRVVLDAPDRAVSKTHLEVGSDGASAWMLDRHSRNGTALIRDGVTRVIEPERRVQLADGDVVRIGRSTSFSVETTD